MTKKEKMELQMSIESQQTQNSDMMNHGCCEQEDDGRISVFGDSDMMDY